MEELTGLSAKWASTMMAQHLLAAADRYALERLRILCEAKLCEDVAINTVATTLALAEQHHCFQLKTVCLKFVALPENLRGNLLFFLPWCRTVYNYRNPERSLNYFSSNYILVRIRIMEIKMIAAYLQ